MSEHLWVRNDGDGWTRLHRSIRGEERERHPVIASWRDGDLLGELLRGVLPGSPDEHLVCNCYPGGYTHDTFEGPQPWCNVHGQPEAAWSIQQRKIDRLEAELVMVKARLSAEGAP